MKRLRDNSLWLISVGLMLASSGIDGAYLARLMPVGWAWLGYVLNTVSDISGMVLIYWFGRLRQDRSSVKRRLAWALLPAEAVTVFYSWYLSWRQLLIVLPAIEGDEAGRVALVIAGLIPLQLAFIGYAQALLTGRLEAKKKVADEGPVTAVFVPRWPDKASFLADNGRPGGLTAEELAGLTGQSVRNARRWLADVRTVAGGGVQC